MEEGNPEDRDSLHAIEPREARYGWSWFHGISHSSFLSAPTCLPTARLVNESVALVSG